MLRSISIHFVFFILSLCTQTAASKEPQNKAILDKAIWQSTQAELEGLAEKKLFHFQQLSRLLDQVILPEDLLNHSVNISKVQKTQTGHSDEKTTRPQDSFSEKRSYLTYVDEVGDFRIPRSILTQIILESYELELAQMKEQFFCEGDCSKSRSWEALSFRDLKLKQVIWLKIKTSFSLLWKEIPLATWERMIHLRTYARYVSNQGHYYAAAFGKTSMLAGAVGFGLAYGTTELAETLFLGPLHFVCHANYIWSVAIASAIANSTREIKIALLHEAEIRNFIGRLMSLPWKIYQIRNFKKLTKSATFQIWAPTGDNSSLAKKNEASSASEKDKSYGLHSLTLTQRQAAIQYFQKVLEASPALKPLSIDSELWPELVDMILKSNRQDLNFKLPSSKSWIFDKPTRVQNQSVTPDAGYWEFHDTLAAARHLAEQIKSQALILSQQNRFNRDHLKTLGLLDNSLHSLKTWLVLSSNNGQLPHAADLLGRIVTTQLAVINSRQPLDQLQARAIYLQEAVYQLARAGSPAPRSHQPSAFHKEPKSAPSRSQCQSVFRN